MRVTYRTVQSVAHINEDIFTVLRKKHYRVTARLNDRLYLNVADTMWIEIYVPVSGDESIVSVGDASHGDWISFGPSIDMTVPTVISLYRQCCFCSRRYDGVGLALSFD